MMDIDLVQKLHNILLDILNHFKIEYFITEILCGK
jgi:hypothetical protein